jgi:predicted nucleic acid-binding protein
MNSRWVSKPAFELFENIEDGSLEIECYGELFVVGGVNNGNTVTYQRTITIPTEVDVRKFTNTYEDIKESFRQWVQECEEENIS